MEKNTFLESRIKSYGNPTQLGQKQELFQLLSLKLQLFAIEQGFSIRLGHAFRCENCVVGKKLSNHKLKLAIDLNLFKDGVFLQNTEDHKQLGEYWESLHPQCAWGGRFNDGNHYSLEHNGRK